MASIQSRLINRQPIYLPQDNSNMNPPVENHGQSADCFKSKISQISAQHAVSHTRKERSFWKRQMDGVRCELYNYYFNTKNDDRSREDLLRQIGKLCKMVKKLETDLKKTSDQLGTQIRINHDLKKTLNSQFTFTLEQKTENRKLRESLTEVRQQLASRQTLSESESVVSKIVSHVEQYLDPCNRKTSSDSSGQNKLDVSAQLEAATHQDMTERPSICVEKDVLQLELRELKSTPHVEDIEPTEEKEEKALCQSRQLESVVSKIDSHVEQCLDPCNRKNSADSSGQNICSLKLDVSAQLEAATHQDMTECSSICVKKDVLQLKLRELKSTPHVEDIEPTEEKEEKALCQSSQLQYTVEGAPEVGLVRLNDISELQPTLVNPEQQTGEDDKRESTPIGLHSGTIKSRPCTRWSNFWNRINLFNCFRNKRRS